MRLGTLSAESLSRPTVFPKREAADRPPGDRGGEPETKAADRPQSFENRETKTEYIKMNIPNHIIEAVNALLAPYGERFIPGLTRAVSKSGYTNWGGAVKYTGLSKSTLQRAIKAGELKPPHKMTESKNGTALFEFSELDLYIRSH